MYFLGLLWRLAPRSHTFAAVPAPVTVFLVADILLRIPAWTVISDSRILPMEVRKPNFKTHNYILYKADGEWCEGRISAITFEGDKEVYHVFSLATFTNKVFGSADFLAIPTPDLRKRLKTALFLRPPGTTHIPPPLRNALIADSEWAKDNLYDPVPKVTVRVVLAQFESFMLANSMAVESDEIVEISHGLRRAFDFFFPRALLYADERERLSPLVEEPSGRFGPIYLLRLVYFLQKRGRIYIPDKLVESIMLGSTIYLLDFLLIKYNEYF